MNLETNCRELHNIAAAITHDVNLSTSPISRIAMLINLVAVVVVTVFVGTDGGGGGDTNV